MYIDKKDLRGNWKNKNEYFMFNFYPQIEETEELKCSISLENNNLIFDGVIDILQDTNNNENEIIAGDYKFIIKHFNRNENFMILFNEELGTIEVSK